MARITNTALALAIVSFLLSSAAFTPMVFAAWFAAAIGAIGVWLGHVRRGLLTIYFAVGATIVSPIFMKIQSVDLLLIAIPIIGALIALVSWWTYRQSKESS
jgi:hypothetical protein